MKAYRRILLALELDQNIDTLPVRHAVDLVEECESELYIIHVMEHLGSYGAAYGVAAGADIETILINKASSELKKIGKLLGVKDKEDHVILKQGAGAPVILEEAERLSIDLIVVGSHARHGIRLILGSTADGVVTKAKCDVLAVRIPD